MAINFNNKSGFNNLKLLLAGLILLSFQPALGDETSTVIADLDIKLHPTGLTPSAECGKCHKDIYSTWRNSLHAQALDNPVFQAAFLQAHFKIGEASRQICLPCHAPIALLNDDFKLTDPLSREGVNCDFCHTIESTETVDRKTTYLHAPGLLKQGPLDNVTSPVHQTRFNELYANSVYCAGCHEYENPDGVPLIETFTEWQNSPYPEKNIHCQNCHMRKIPGKIVAEDIKMIPETAISSHDIAGGHSLSMREKSLKLEIKDIEINKQRVVVNIDVTNSGAGHKIPTGLPSKKLILQVAIVSEYGEALQIQEKIYQKRLIDVKGDPVLKDADIFIEEGLRIVSDNRIVPLETRRESFVFFVEKDKRHRVTASIYYSHVPEIIQTSPIHIKMAEVSRILER